jgi:hypothetical protein
MKKMNLTGFGSFASGFFGPCELKESNKTPKNILNIAGIIGYVADFMISTGDKNSKTLKYNGVQKPKR